MKIIFAGTPHFAASALAALLKEHQIVAVLTQPDRPSGRGMQLTASPVKQLAFQAFGVQPGISVAEQATKNVVADKPVTDNLGHAYVEGAVVDGRRVLRCMHCKETVHLIEGATEIKR